MRKQTRLRISDVARLAGVSRTTVSLVLNDHTEQFRISEATQDRVRAIAREHHFQPSQSARALRSGCSKTLGLVIPDLTNYVHARLAQAMESICCQTGYQLLVVTSNDDPLQQMVGMRHLIAREVDGLLMVPCTTDKEDYCKWNSQLPLVLVDRRLEASSLPFVVTDAKSAVTEMVFDALRGDVDEAYYFGGQPYLSPNIDRLNGFRTALAQAGLSEHADWVRSRDFRPSSGYEMMKECYKNLGRYPRFLFTSGITLLEGALSFIRENRHFNIAPERITTFDDHILLDCLPLNIDSIEQDSHGLAEASIKRLIDLINGKEPTSCEIPARLHWRSRREAF